MRVEVLVWLILTLLFLEISSGEVVGGERQRGVLVPGPNEHLHLVHIAKCAGRSVKNYHDKLWREGSRSGKSGSPFEGTHGHSVRAADIEAMGHTAVVVIRDPVERFESAFTFIRTGGFGVRLPIEHALLRYNSSDALVDALRSADPAVLVQGRDGLRCDAKFRYCSPGFSEQDPYDLMRHTSIEFRPQVWWLNNRLRQNVRIICFPDLSTTFPSLKSGRLQQRRQKGLKGHWYIARALQNPANIQFVKDMYRVDTELYTRVCGTRLPLLARGRR
jgi:hypothetical protein